MLHLTGLPIAPDQTSLTRLQRIFLAEAIPVALDWLDRGGGGDGAAVRQPTSGSSVRDLVRDGHRRRKETTT